MNEFQFGKFSYKRDKSKAAGGNPFYGTITYDGDGYDVGVSRKKSGVKVKVKQDRK